MVINKIISANIVAAATVATTGRGNGINANTLSQTPARFRGSLLCDLGCRVARGTGWGLGAGFADRLTGF